MPNDTLFAGSSLCVVGNINRDIKTAPLRGGPQLLADGETSVAWVTETIGGGGANSAFAARSLGARVAFMGKVGVDELGTRLEETLKLHGIEAHLAKDRAHASGTSVALAFEDGHRHFLSCLPANRALTPADLDLTVLPHYDHLLRADIWFSESMLFEGNKELFQQARKAGRAISIDLNWDPCWGSLGSEEVRARKEAVRAVLPWVTLAHGNSRELTAFAETSDLETALKYLTDWGVEAVVLHLGARGAGYFCEEKLWLEPPAPTRCVVQTTGTGDALSVCMMLLHGRPEIPISERLRLANAIVAEFMEGSRTLIPPLID